LESGVRIGDWGFGAAGWCRVPSSGFRVRFSGFGISGFRFGFRGSGGEHWIYEEEHAFQDLEGGKKEQDALRDEKERGDGFGF